MEHKTAGNHFLVHHQERVYHSIHTLPKRHFGFVNSFCNSSVQILVLQLSTDNQPAIALMKEHQYHVRTKHIDIHYHFICWVIEEGKLQQIYCPTEEMVADILTKVLILTKVKFLWLSLGSPSLEEECWSQVQGLSVSFIPVPRC